MGSRARAIIRCFGIDGVAAQLPLQGIEAARHSRLQPVPRQRRGTGEPGHLVRHAYGDRYPRRLFWRASVINASMAWPSDG